MTLRCFALIWKETDRQAMLDFLDQVPEIVNWRTISGSVIIVSARDEDWLATKIHQKYPELTFIVAPLRLSEIQGMQPKETWDFIEKPKPA